MILYTYQDFMSDRGGTDGALGYAVGRAVMSHRSSELFRIAVDANRYDAQKNTTITNYVRTLYSAYGKKDVDRYASNNRITSSFFRRLNTQRMAYSLGNGVTFLNEGTKERLGIDCDTRIRDAGYYALIHGMSFIFLNVDRLHVFKVTEFAPLWDEESGTMMAGVRFWQIDENKPVMAVLYEIDGYTRLRAESNSGNFRVIEEKRAYRYNTVKAPSDEEPEVVGEENYNALPIIPLYGSRLKQSTLVGLKESIDAYDLIRSGFANDLQDCAEIYWLLGNAGGMDDADLAQFRDRLKLQHIAVVGDADDVTVTPYTQDIPMNARETFLDRIRTGIYEDFGALDVHSVEAGSTNDHLEAAYQPLDENADDFEYQIIETVQALLRLIGIDDTPQFKRNRISNQREQTEMVLSAADYIDSETILTLLPFITPDMIEEIMARKEAEESERYGSMEMTEPDTEPEETEEVTTDEVGVEKE